MTIRLAQLAPLLAATIVLVGIGGIAATWRMADGEFRDVLEDDLEQQAELLAELLATGPAQLSDAELNELLTRAFEDDDEETLWVSVYDVESDRMLSNLEHDLPLESESDGPLRRLHGGFGWHGIQERAGRIVVQLLRRDDIYAEVQEEILEDIVTPALIGSAVTLLLLAVLIILALGPLTRLARELEERSADSLAPLETKTPTREIRVLRESINDLMRGIDTVVRRERQFASDVAHELRTPLTTLKLELASAEPDIAALKSEVDRLVRLVEQLLTLARLEQAQWQRRFDSLSLSDLYVRVIDRLDERFRRAKMTLESRLSPTRVAGDATLLEVLLENLLQNVLAHCPAGTRASVRLDPVGRSVRLRVADDGPGIAAEILQRMSGTFTRLDSRRGGFGIGLAICHRIVEAHGGEIEFSAGDDQGRGLVVEVRIPV